MSEMRNFLESEKIAQVSAAMIIVEQANKIKALEAKNGELETWKNKAKEKMPAMQMKIHELEGKLEIAVEALSKVLKNRRCSEHAIGDCPTDDEKRIYVPISEALAAINGEGV